MTKVCVLILCFCLSAVYCQNGFFPQREDRRVDATLGFNVLQDLRKITQRLTGVLHLQPENQSSNPAYIFPFNNRPGISNEHQYTHQYQNAWQYGQNGYYGQNQPYEQNGQSWQNGQNAQNEPNGQNVQYRPNYLNVQNGQNVQNGPNEQNRQNEQNEQYEQNGQYEQNQNGHVSFPSDPTQVNFVNNYNEPDPVPNESGNQNGREDGDSVIFVNPDENIQNGQDTSAQSNGEIFFVPPNEQNGIPSTPPQGQSGIPSTPPQGQNDIPSTPLQGQNDIPSTLPQGQNGIPFTPSQGQNGIPSTLPQGYNVFSPIPASGQNGIPSIKPVTFNDGPYSTTALPELTPVPDFEKRDNFNFGPAGLYQEPCETVDKELGSCISVVQCPRYVKILKESRTNPNAVQLLRRAHCGFDGNKPKVCCPLPGIPSELPPPPPTTTTTTTTTTAAPEHTSREVAEGDFVASLPVPPVCGVSNASFSRVVGGVKAKLGDFPWMALLGYKSRRGPGARWLCGGALISSRHVLTAAHCIHGRENDLFLVRLGELDLEREDEGATPVDVPIKAKIKHEEYSSTAFTSDIGILVLEREVAFTHLIKPICIPENSELRARSFVNYNPIIAGWGDTEFRGPSATHLMALQLPVVTNEFCAQAYSQYSKQHIDERVLCAGYKKGGKDACQGDSGGPLMQPIWNEKDFTTHFYQIGVVSFGKKCAEPGFPGVYSRVTHFVPWIQEKVLGIAA